MQKIVFVGIILIIGLFSLQYVLSSQYSKKFETNALPNNNFTSLINEKPVTQVVYICPEDTVIYILPQEDFRKL
jgi:hypothetical protein